MGSGSSTQKSILDQLSSEDLALYTQEYSILGLTEKDIIQIYTVFRQIDIDNEGSVSLDRICDFFKIEKNAFTTIIFTSFDVDLYQLDEVDFPRFLQAIWNFCALDDKVLSMSTCVMVLMFYL